MSKKKFKDTKVGKFLLNKGSDLINVVGDVLPDSGALGVLKGLISSDDSLPQQDKETALKLLEMDVVEMQEVSDPGIVTGKPLASLPHPFLRV